MPTLKLKKIEYVENDVSCHDLSTFILEVTGNKLSVYGILSFELRHSYCTVMKYVVSMTPNVQWTRFCLYNDSMDNMQDILNGLCADKFIEPGTYTIRLT